MFLLHFTDELMCAYLCSVGTYRVFPWKIKKAWGFFSTQTPWSNIFYTSNYISLYDRGKNRMSNILNITQGIITSLNTLGIWLSFTSVNSPFVVLSYLKRGCQETCLNKFIEGNGIISVRVGFLYGPVGNASQLVIRNIYTNHHAQNLE